MVSFSGYLHGQAKLDALASADIFVLPSHAEGMSNSLLEAMASGCACIAASVGGSAELIHDQSVGMLFEPRDVDALGNALVKVARNHGLREAMQRAARKRAHGSFDVEQAAEKFWTLFTG
jgi:glycosyltransferase involved in cell wall biosynthesis